MADPLHLVNVGGSLFKTPSFPRLIIEWLSRRRDERLLLVPGGGELANHLRNLSQSWSTKQSSAHWAAIDVMSAHTRMLADLLDRHRDTIGRAHRVLDPGPLLRIDAGRTLPMNWEVTSDSIAAWLALQMNAVELLLLKSVGGSEPLKIADAVSRGWVDPVFPAVASRLTVSWVNLLEGRTAPLLMEHAAPEGAPEANGRVD
ncbi:hypothetical protein [Planctomycetes bacterium Pan216]|uniref:hypothetical protein n=1 Tax=Kolteria novifilia TaxID=2527975 RepID=UPI0011A23162